MPTPQIVFAFPAVTVDKRDLNPPGIAAMTDHKLAPAAADFHRIRRLQPYVFAEVNAAIASGGC